MSNQKAYGLMFVAYTALTVFIIFEKDLSSLSRLGVFGLACNGAIIGALYVLWLKARNESRKAGAAK